MALESLRSTVSALLGGPQNFIGDLEIDVIRREAPMYNNQVTRKKAEVGVDTTNLVVNDPIGLTLDITLTTDLLGQSWQDKWAILRGYWLTGEAVTVVTEFETYESMVVENISPNRDPNNSDAFVGSIRFTAVRFINTEFTTLPNSAEELGAAGAGTADGGVKQGAPVSDQSAAAAAFDALF